MFAFQREKILPVFLAKRITVQELARLAGISHNSAFRAVNGMTISAKTVDRAAQALNIDALTFLAEPDNTRRNNL